MPKDIDFIDWEHFEFPIQITNLIFTNTLYKLPSDCVIEVRRDEQYKLIAFISGVISDISKIRDEFGNVAGTFPEEELIQGTDANRLWRFELSGCIVDQPGGPINPMDGSLRFTSQVHFNTLKRLPFYPPPVMSGKGVRYEWFLAGRFQVNWPKGTDRKVRKETSKIRKGIDESTSHTSSEALSSGKDYLVIDSAGLKCIVAEVPKELGPKWAKCICIEYREAFGIPTDEIREGISELVSFVLGTHLLYIGATTLMDNYFLGQEAHSPWGSDIQATCKAPTFPPVRLNIHYDWGHVELLINRLLPAYLEKVDSLQLRGALWNYWVARQLPSGVDLPLFSSAIEAIVARVLKTTPGISHMYMSEKRLSEGNRIRIGEYQGKVEECS